MFHISFFLSHTKLAWYIQIMWKTFQTGCPKTKKTHFFTIKPPRVLKIALKSLIFTPHFSSLTLNLLKISNLITKYFWQGVLKPEKENTKIVQKKNSWTSWTGRYIKCLCQNRKVLKWIYSYSILYEKTYSKYNPNISQN